MEKTFYGDGDVKQPLDECFAFKDESSYRKEIHKLPLRWKKVANDNGNYTAN